MAIEILDLPIKTGDFPQQTVSSPEGIINSHEQCSKPTMWSIRVAWLIGIPIMDHDM